MTQTDAHAQQPLEPCPFCGSRCVTFLTGGPGNWWVQCDDCRASTDDVGHDRALELWNCRTPTTERPSQGVTRTEHQPVAWRWRDADENRWYLESIAPTEPDSEIEVQPLYTADFSPTDEQLEAWAQMLDWDTGLTVKDEVKQLRRLLQHIWHNAAPAPSPAATVDMSNHHNALLCPYCNPKGLKFKESSSPAGNVTKDELATWLWQSHGIELPSLATTECEQIASEILRKFDVRAR